MFKLELVQERASMLSEDLKVMRQHRNCSLHTKHFELLPASLGVFSTTGTYIRTNDGRIFAIRSGKISRPAVGGSAASRGNTIKNHCLSFVSNSICTLMYTFGYSMTAFLSAPQTPRVP